jgi:oligosaccharide repeat unit polymerase
LSTELLRPEPRPPIFAATAFIYVWWTLAGAAQIEHDRWPLGLSYDPDQIAKGALTVLIFTGALFIAYYGRPLKSEDNRHQEFSEPTLLFSWALLLFGAALVLYIGPSAYIRSRAGYSEVLSTRLPPGALTGLVQGFARTMPLYVLLSSLDLLWRDKTRRTGLLIVAGSLVALVANPLSTARYWFGTAYLSIAFLAILRGQIRRRLTTASILAGYVLALSFVFPYLDMFRKTTVTTVNVERPVEIFTTDLDFDSFSSTVWAADLADRRGLTWGKTAVVAPATFWVPRSVWPSKPADVAEEFVRSRGLNEKLNIATSMPASLLVDFGTFGVLLGGALTGVGIRRLSSATAVVGSFSAAYLPIILRGSLTNAVANFVPFFALHLCVVLAARTRSNLASRRRPRSSAVCTSSPYSAGTAASTPSEIRAPDLLARTDPLGGTA